MPVIGEVELAAPFLKGRTIGITGSNGKTTTTSLIGHILREAGVPVQVGGNIGLPVTAMVDTSRDDGWNVLELSSFQLETIVEFRAHIALALNVTQNHLDRHHTFENYAAAKGRLFENQRPGDYRGSECRRSGLRGLRGADRRHARSGSAAAARWSRARSLCSDKLVLDGKLLMQAGEIPDSRPPQCRERAGRWHRRGARRRVARGDRGRGAHVPSRGAPAGIRARAERRRLL